jgi:hypothetical protein
MKGETSSVESGAFSFVQAKEVSMRLVEKCLVHWFINTVTKIHSRSESQFFD